MIAVAKRWCRGARRLEFLVDLRQTAGVLHPLHRCVYRVGRRQSAADDHSVRREANVVVCGELLDLRGDRGLVAAAPMRQAGEALHVALPAADCDALR